MPGAWIAACSAVEGGRRIVKVPGSGPRLREYFAGHDRHRNADRARYKTGSEDADISPMNVQTTCRKAVLDILSEQDESVRNPWGNDVA